jgi:hypothetical protein
VVTSPEVKISTNPDGDVVATTPDGYTVTASPKGDMSVQSPDGSNRGIGRDGTISISDGKGWSMTSSSDGSRSTTTMSSPDGTTIGRDSDGTTSIGRPDGSQTTFRADGTVVHTAPDGTTTVKEPDGTTTVSTPDGRTTITQPDGDVYIENPNGTITGPVINEPGLESVPLPNESIVIGAAESIAETVEFLWSISPLRAIVDKDGWDATIDRLASGLWHAVTNPGDFAEALINLDAWREDPFRAFGRLLPDVAAAALGWGGGAAAKIDDVAGGLARASTWLDNLGGGLTKGPDGVWRQQPSIGDDIADGVTVREGRANRTAAPEPSATLGASLRGTGELPPGPGYDAHHIVPTNAGGEALDEVREAGKEALEGPLDQAANGAWLPNNQAVANEAGGTLHLDYLHTDAGSELYAAEIKARFTDPTTNEPLRGQAFLDKLAETKQELNNGTFRIRY